MKKKNFVLTIDAPCQQEWSSMTKTDDGKYCSKCAKNVVDFTGLSDAEIIRLIERTPGSLCGKLRAHQLNRTFYNGHPTNHSRLYKILAGLLFVGTTESVSAKENNLQQTELVAHADSLGDSGQEQEQIPVQPPAESLPLVARGILIEAESKEPIPFASIAIKGTETGTVSDMEGNFSLTIPDNLVSENITFVIACVGFEQKEFVLSSKELANTSTNNIIPVTRVSQDVYITVGFVVATQPHRWWQFWK